MPRLEDDPSLFRDRLHARWFIDEVMGGCDAGELALIVGLAICERWVLEYKASYGYELAWIFARDRGTIRNALRHLEEGSEIERVDPRHIGRRIFFKPTPQAEAEYLTPKSDESMDDLLPKNIHESCRCNDQLEHAYSRTIARSTT